MQRDFARLFGIVTMQKLVVLNDEDITRLLPRTDVRAALERMFIALADGRAVQPPQTLSLFPAGGGDFITYPGVLGSDGVFGTKLSPYIPGTNGATVTAWTLLMSMETGKPLLLCDSKRLTTERTAATTAIAADLLASKEAKILTIIGTGEIGLAHLRHAASIRPWQEIRLCSPDIANRHGLPVQLESGCPVTKSTYTDTAAAGADVVMLCTSSGTSVIDASRFGAGVLVTSISTNVANAHEIAPDTLNRFDVYCDYRATTPAAAGEMKLAAERGQWSTDRLVGDLPELLSGRTTARDTGRPAFFRSIGLGLEDIATASALLSAARS